eukprot:2189239-Amphidinium_carterae.1
MIVDKFCNVSLNFEFGVWVLWHYEGVVGHTYACTHDAVLNCVASLFCFKPALRFDAILDCALIPLPIRRLVMSVLRVPSQTYAMQSF